MKKCSANFSNELGKNSAVIQGLTDQEAIYWGGAKVQHVIEWPANPAVLQGSLESD